MPLQFGAQSASLGLPQPTTQQSIVCKSKLNVTDDYTLHTVTTGKTLYITGISYSSGATGVLGLKQGSDVFFPHAILSATANATQEVFANGTILMTYASGTDIKAYCTVAGGNNQAITIFGYEQ